MELGRDSGGCCGFPGEVAGAEEMVCATWREMNSIQGPVRNAILIGTCSFWIQPPEPMASEVESGSGACQERKRSALRPTLVLKDALVLSGLRRRKVTSASAALSRPQMLSHIPSPTRGGRWLSILQGPLSIPLAKSHIPEQRMFHLRPTRFVLPSGAKKKTLAQAADF